MKFAACHIVFADDAAAAGGMELKPKIENLIKFEAGQHYELLVLKAKG